jgi:DNA-binding XRE family transcriptional regulator
MPKKASNDALEVLQRRFYTGKPHRQKNLETARANDEIARRLTEMRAEAGLTQTELAKLIGTTASVISRLEDANYQGHSLALLRRIAGALNRRVEIRLVPLRRSA